MTASGIGGQGKVTSGCGWCNGHFIGGRGTQRDPREIALPACATPPSCTRAMPGWSQRALSERPTSRVALWIHPLWSDESVGAGAPSPISHEGAGRLRVAKGWQRAGRGGQGRERDLVAAEVKEIIGEEPRRRACSWFRDEREVN